MKKQKMLAVLLCLMLVVTTIPMLALAAPADSDTFATMNAVLSAHGVATNYAATAYWSMMEKIPSGTAGFQNAPHGATIDPEKGTYINGAGSNATFRYNNGDPLWSSLETKKRFVYFKAQVSETDKLEVMIQDPTGANKRGSFTISATAFGETYFGGLYYNRAGGAGTKMNEYLLFNDFDGIVKLYVKGEDTSNQWVRAANAYTFNDPNTTGNGLHFSGTGYVKDVTLYGPAVTYENIDTIADEKLYNMPAYEKTDETTITAGTSNYRYMSPVGPSISEGMVPVFRAKLDSADSSMRIVLRKPGETSANYISYEFIVTPDLVKTESASVFVNDTFKFTNYVDYALFATKAECKLYAKSDNQLGGKWIHLLTDTTASSSDSSFYAAPVILVDAGSSTVNNLKIYQPMESYASLNAAAGGSVIAEQSITDFMRYTPTATYSPLENGVFTFNATACEDGKALRVFAHDPSTTNKAYAFKLTKEGFEKNDSQQVVVLNEGFVPGTEAHDYLVTENKAKDGVVVYVKDADENWVPVFGITGYAVSTPNNGTYGLYIFKDENSKAVLNSATVYTKDSLVLADGSGNAVYNDGTLTTPAALRIKNNGATGKLLVVSYKGNDMAKAQLVDAASVTAEGQVFDTTADGVTKVKVFHWDSFTGLNRVTPAVTLNYAQ